jgi:hypothetical protein
MVSANQNNQALPGKRKIHTAANANMKSSVTPIHFNMLRLLLRVYAVNTKIMFHQLRANSVPNFMKK